MTSILSAPHFHDEAAAYAYVEARLWKDGRDCPHCGVVDNSVKLTGKSTRIGTYKCRACRKPFTVKVNTVFEQSHVKMHIWLQAIHLMASSKKGFSSNQFARTLGITLKAAWFVSMRLREAMKESDLIPFGIDGGTVEIDETYFGTAPNADPDKAQNWAQKNKIVALVDRNTGRARSMVVDDLKLRTMIPLLKANLAPGAHAMTDEHKTYASIGTFVFGKHSSVNHSKEEYVSRDDPTVHTNTIEGYFSVFKRGMRGTYQHCSPTHLHRYATEFDFRYSNRIALGVDDRERADRLLMGVRGKRLTYGTTDKQKSAA